MMYRLFWLGLFFVAACASQPAQTVTANWGEHTTLSFAQEAQLPDGMGSIIFEKLVKDHRCPIDAQCLTQGTATVALTWVKADKEREMVELSVGDSPKLEYIFEDFVLKLIEVRPLPKSGKSPEEQNYYVVIELMAK